MLIAGRDIQQIDSYIWTDRRMRGLGAGVVGAEKVFEVGRHLSSLGADGMAVRCCRISE